MSVVDRLDAWQQRHPAAGIPVAVLYKFLDDQGVYLAVVIAFFAFFSLFPALLLLSSILGFVLANQPGLRDEIISTATDFLPVVGQQIQSRGLSGTPLSIALGTLGALYGALGVANAVQNALNAAWNVPRNRRPNPVLLRVRGVVIIAMLGVFVVAATVLAQLPAALGALGVANGPWSQFVGPVASFMLSVALFVLLTRYATAREIGHRTMLPGAVLAALLWQLLQSGGGSLVGYYAASAPVTEGLFGVVVGLLGWLYLASIALVFCFEVNSVLGRGMYPRALKAALSDDADLTEADRDAYAHLAQTQSLKGFEQVHVTFDRSAADAVTDGDGETSHRPGGAKSHDGPRVS